MGVCVCVRHDCQSFLDQAGGLSALLANTIYACAALPSSGTAA